MVGVRILLSWLESFPGDTWQQRWEASPIATEPERRYEKVREWTPTVDRATKTGHLQAGLLALLCADVVRPDTTWLTVNYSRHLRPALAQSRDPEGFASLEAWIPQNVRVTRHASEALAALAQVLATRGGKLQDIVVGDLLEQCYAPVACNRTTRGVRLAYLWLRARGQFPHDAPTTLLFTTHRDRWDPPSRSSARRSPSPRAASVPTATQKVSVTQQASDATWVLRNGGRSGRGRPSRSSVTPGSGSRSSRNSATTASSATGCPAGTSSRFSRSRLRRRIRNSSSSSVPSLPTCSARSSHASVTAPAECR